MKKFKIVKKINVIGRGWLYHIKSLEPFVFHLDDILGKKIVMIDDSDTAHVEEVQMVEHSSKTKAINKGDEIGIGIR